MNPRGSLRWRLVASMFFVFVLGLGGALGLHPLEERGAFLARSFAGLGREPYQDLTVLVAFSLVAMAIIWLVSGWSLRGLSAASREAAKVGPRNPDARISTVRLPTEVHPMVQAVNGALDRLADAYGAERRFVADAAHQLRTPLAVLKLRVERTRASLGPDGVKLAEDIEVLERLVRQLLELARKEHDARTDSLEFALVNLSRAAREATADILPMANRMGRNIEIKLPEALWVRGRLEDLRELIRNFLENALVHGAGTVRVVGREASSGTARTRSALLGVSDEGSGLPDSTRIVAFDRFWKSNPNSIGSGLGLAIARQIADLHGGTIAFIGEAGCTVQFAIPSAAEAHGFTHPKAAE